MNVTTVNIIPDHVYTVIILGYDGGVDTTQEITRAMTTQQPTEAPASYHHGDLRNALIQAGLTILAEEGVHALTLRAVARRVGVSHAAPYRHFADKEALLAAIAEQGFDMLALSVRAAAERFPADPAAQLAEAGWAYVRFGLEHPAHLRVMFGGLISTPTMHPGLRTAGAAAFAGLVDIVQAGQRAGAMVGAAPEQLTLTAWALVHGLAVLAIEHQIPEGIGGADDPERLARICGNLLYEGMRQSAPSGTAGPAESATPPAGESSGAATPDGNATTATSEPSGGAEPGSMATGNGGIPMETRRSTADVAQDAGETHTENHRNRSPHTP
jgi:AcrR family transcriptional regulator